jgi:PadR family transcriptional regulator PadR
MAADRIPGELEQTVMLAILRVDAGAYGVQIRDEIHLCTGRVIAPGALYTTLERLEKKGFVQFSSADPTPERGGRAKNIYRVTDLGRSHLAAAQANFKRLMRGLELLGGVDA